MKPEVALLNLLEAWVLNAESIGAIRNAMEMDRELTSREAEEVWEECRLADEIAGFTNTPKPNPEDMN